MNLFENTCQSISCNFEKRLKNLEENDKIDMQIHTVKYFHSNANTHLLEDDLSRRQPRYKMNSMEDNINGRQPQWKMTSLEDDRKWKTNSIEDNFIGRQLYWKTTSIYSNV